MAHFYLRDELNGAEIGSVVSVSGAEARHAVSVSRLGVGDRISVGDGAGLVVDGVVVAAAP
ncbi:MAG: rRNA (uracil1498-N3)-methyltransferase, partial [Microbacteriaceae bacterium]|nr:rRNA (uracil1498-N3)-methyltransferase [Microbacteriaceae bacterium]